MGDIDPADPIHADRHSALALALMVLVIVAAHVSIFYAPNTWIKRDGRFYTNMNVTIVEDFGLERERVHGAFSDYVERCDVGIES